MGIWNSVPDANEYGRNYTYFEFSVYDGTQYSTGPGKLVFDVEPRNVVWFSTTDAESDSERSDVPSWDEGDVLQMGGLDFALGSDSQGTLSVPFSFESHFPGTKIDALHYVNQTITIGSTHAIELNPGDILFSTESNVDLGMAEDALESDILLYQASTGTFDVLFDMSSSGVDSSATHDDFWSITLVENNTTVGRLRFDGRSNSVLS